MVASNIRFSGMKQQQFQGRREFRLGKSNLFHHTMLQLIFIQSHLRAKGSIPLMFFVQVRDTLIHITIDIFMNQFIELHYHEYEFNFVQELSPTPQLLHQLSNFGMNRQVSSLNLKRTNPF